MQTNAVENVWGSGIRGWHRPPCHPRSMIPISYGSTPEQRAELWLPDDRAQAVAVVVLVHGGFWRARYGADLMHGLARDLLDRGFAAWNVEYRRVGSNGGDPLQTLADVAAAIDRLPMLEREHGLDLRRVAFVGHSAGGHLALWAGGVELAVAPSIVIGQAAVSDLTRAAVERLGDGAVQDFCGGEPHEVAERYDAAQPRLDADLVHLVHGDGDDTVPAAHSVEAVAVDGRSVPHTIVAGADHMAVIDPGSRAWAVQVGLLERALAPGR